MGREAYAAEPCRLAGSQTFRALAQEFGTRASSPHTSTGTSLPARPVRYYSCPVVIQAAPWLLWPPLRLGRF
jgi:hypothetical protein